MTAFIIPTRTLPDAAQLILGLLAEGRSDSEIAEAVGMRRGALGTEVRRLLASLGAESRAQAVAMGYRQGWLARVPASRLGWPLSARELEAVELLVACATDAQACAQLDVKLTWLRELYVDACKHTGARNRAHLVRIAIDTGLVAVPDQGGAS